MNQPQSRRARRESESDRPTPGRLVGKLHVIGGAFDPANIETAFAQGLAVRQEI